MRQGDTPIPFWREKKLINQPLANRRGLLAPTFFQRSVSFTGDPSLSSAKTKPMMMMQLAAQTRAVLAADKLRGSARSRGASERDAGSSEGSMEDLESRTRQQNEIRESASADAEQMRDGSADRRAAQHRPVNTVLRFF